MTKKLGIVLPTYNRCEYLKMALDALLPQAEAHKDTVMIVVSDNCSIDGTESYMKEVSAGHSDILTYYRHEENGGYLFNFKYGIANVDAEYVFIHGDDDMVTPYYLDYLLRVLEENPDVDLVHYNYFISSLDGTPIRMLYKDFSTDGFIHHYDNLKAFLNGRYDCPSFMSSNVFRKSIWDANVDDEKQYQCAGFEWLYIMLKGCVKSNHITFIETPLFVQRMSPLESYSDKRAWYMIVSMARVFEEIGKEYYDQWIDYRKQYSRPKMLSIISAVHCDKKRYRRDYHILRKYIYTGFYQAVLFVCLYVLPTWLERIIVNKAHKHYVK